MSRPPETWVGLCRFLGVPEGHSRTVWTGLTRAKSAAVVQLCASFAFHEAVLAAPRPGVLQVALKGLTSIAASPANLIHAVETCVREQTLRRAEASRFEEYVLRGMGFDAAAQQAWEQAHRPWWTAGPRPDWSRWLSRAEREQQRPNGYNYVRVLA